MSYRNSSFGLWNGSIEFLFPVQYLDIVLDRLTQMIVRDVLDFKRSRCFPFLAHLQRLSAVVSESERTGFAQRGWEGPILASSHCLGSLPCVSCYMGSKCQHKDTPENP